MKTSVVIPCHNAAEFVGQTIGSLLEQSRPPHEIVVVVDSSTDRSAEVARSFGRPVRVCEREFGQASKTRNYGARLCSGDALLFCDADDVLSPDALAGLEDALTEEPGGIALLPWLRLELIDGNWVQRPASVPPKRRGQDRLAGWLTGRYYPPCCMLWSREAFVRIGGWSEEFCPNDDGDIATRALVDGVPFRHAKKGRAYYRRIPANDSLSGKRFTAAGLTSRLRVIEKLASWLEERRRIDAYRYPITYALEEIRRDSLEGGFPQVAERCEAVRSRAGLSRTAWKRRRGLQKAGFHTRIWKGRAGSAARKLIGHRRPNPADTEIRFGLETAKAAQNRPAARVTAPDPTAPAAPTVSVIIPTYNRAQLVTRAIHSVLKQSFADFEVLVVDDASTDDTLETVAAIADPRIRYLRQPVNQDVSAARNRGLRAARGEFIAFLDSDDEWLPGKLEAQVARFRDAPDSVGLVYSGSITRYDDGKENVFQPEHRGDVFREILLKNITDTGSASVMVRRNVLRVVGFFDERIPAMEDYDYWIRAARFYDFDFVDEPLVRYHETQRSDRRSLIPESDATARRHLFEKYRSSLKEYGLTHKFLMISARRMLQRYRQADRLGAFSLSVQAALANPKKAESYKTAIRSLVPGSVWNATVGRAKSLKRRAATG